MRFGVLALLAAVGIVFATLASADTTLTLSATTGRPYLAVTVTGAGFGASEAVDVYFDTSDTLLLVSTAAGAVTGSLTIPSTASPGLHYITLVGRRADDAAQTSFTVATAWAELGFGLGHLGWNPYENTISAANAPSLGVLWSSTTQGSGSTPAVANGRAIFTTPSGMEAFNAATGAVQWNKSTLGQMYASPVAYGNEVYAGNLSGVFYSLNATTGGTVWSKTFPGYIYSSATVVGTLVYFGCGDGNVYALQASTGAVVWSFKTGGMVESSPTVVGNVLYVGATDGLVYALNATTGVAIWTYTTGGSVESSAAVVNGVVYIGSDDDKVYALGAATGGLLWSYATGSDVYSPPAVALGIVYVGSADGKLYALDARTGAIRWTFAMGSIVRPAIVANGLVYVNNGYTFVLDAASGELLASSNTGTTYLGTMAVANGILYVNTEGNLYALAPNAGVNSVPVAPRAPRPETLRPDMRLVAAR